MVFKEGSKIKIKATGKVGVIVDQNGHAAKLKVPGEHYNRWYHQDELVGGRGDKGDKGKGKGKEGKGKGKEGKGKDGKGKDGKGKSKGKGKQYTEYVSSTGPVRADGGYRLNVKNLSSSHDTNDKLFALFKPYGFVCDYDVRTHSDGSSKGFGYVVMKNETQAKKAIEGLNGKIFDDKTLEVVPAERRSDGKGSTQGTAVDFNEQMQAISYMAYITAWQHTCMQNAYMQAMAGAQTYEGSLKSISAKNGYGFIVCADTYALYQRDVYIDKKVLPKGARPSDRVSFTVAMNEKGHPYASTASIVELK